MALHRWSRSLIAGIGDRVMVSVATRQYSDQPDKWLPYVRRQFVRRQGYEPHHHTHGALPRLLGDLKPLKTINQDNNDPWHKSKALFGQNDYIDILGDGGIEPRRLLFNMPSWLRGFRGNELQMLNRKRYAVDNWKHLRPRRYEWMKARVTYLYRRLNQRVRPPDYKKPY